MSKNTELFREINTYENSACHKLFRGLFSSLIYQIRERNDTATGDDVIRNQGVIKEMKNLLKLTDTKSTGDDFRDGAYTP